MILLFVRLHTVSNLARSTAMAGEGIGIARVFLAETLFRITASNEDNSLQIHISSL